MGPNASKFPRWKLQRAARRFRWLTLGLFLTRAAEGSPPSAEPALDDPAVHFRRAVDALRALDRSGALEEFRVAERLAPAATTLWNIVVLEIDLGMPRDAHRDLLAYRVLAGATMSSERSATVDKTLEDLEHKLARVRVELYPREAFLRIDDADSERTVWLAPGDHVFEASAPGYTAKRETITLDAGASPEVRLDLVPLFAGAADSKGPVPPPEPSDSTAAVHRRDTRIPLAYGIGGAGIAFIGVGAYFGLDAFSKRHQSNALCQADDRCTAPGRELNDAAYRSALVSDIGFAAGGVLLGTAAYLFLSSSASSTPKQPGVTGFRPQISPTAVGVVAVGTM